MFNMLRSLMALPLEESPCDEGSEAFRKGRIPKDNPYPLNDDKDDHRWYRWKLGWGRARIDAIVAEKGTCAGAHIGNDRDDRYVCDINGVGWKSVGTYSSQCETCREVWELDWGGWKYDKDETNARNPELGHSFQDDRTSCTKCGARFSAAAAEPCVNREDDKDLTKWLDARDDLKDARWALVRAEEYAEETDLRLSVCPCPRCHGGGDSACRMCRGEGTIGKKQE